MTEALRHSCGGQWLISARTAKCDRCDALTPVIWRPHLTEAAWLDPGIEFGFDPGLLADAMLPAVTS
jgi:hypothetical protein